MRLKYNSFTINVLSKHLANQIKNEKIGTVEHEIIVKNISSSINFLESIVAEQKIEKIEFEKLDNKNTRTFKAEYIDFYKKIAEEQNKNESLEIEIADLKGKLEVFEFKEMKDVSNTESNKSLDLKILIQNGEIEKTLNILNQEFKSNTELFNELSLVKFKYSLINRQNTQGLISRANFQLELSAIVFAVLGLCDRI